MDIIIIGLLVIVALYKSIRYRQHKKWALGLIVALLIGAGDFLISMTYSHRRNCGKVFNPDIGCLNAMPGWLTWLGIGALIATILISSIIIILSVDKSTT